MAKKYTVMIFDPEKYGKSKTIFISKRPSAKGGELAYG